MAMLEVLGKEFLIDGFWEHPFRAILEWLADTIIVLLKIPELLLFYALDVSNMGFIF